MNWIYETDIANKNRYILGHFEKNPILCIGVNPSTALPEKLDNTIRSVERIAKANGYDGWIMANLYPQRATNPNDLDRIANIKELENNCEAIYRIVKQYSIKEIWAAWGTLINKRDYLLASLNDLYNMMPTQKWITFGKLSNDGDPHHPLYLNSGEDKKAFDIKNYLEMKGKKSYILIDSK